MLVTENQQAALVYGAALLLYPSTAMWMVWRGWTIRAGFVTALIAIVPQLWENLNSPDFSGPYGYGFLLMLLLGFSTFLVLIGLIAAAVRACRLGR